MGKKPKPGYWQNGVWMDLADEEKGPPSRTELKAASHALQDLGEALMTLRDGLFKKLEETGDITERLAIEIRAAKKITAHEGRRRQMQFIGKLMRTLPEESVAAISAAIDEQHNGSAAETRKMHLAERLRDNMVAGDDAVTEFVEKYGPATDEEGTPTLDVQQLRTLVRLARKEAAASASAPPGKAPPRQGKAFRELFQLVKPLLS
jgi:ribosome-associated protein